MECPVSAFPHVKTLQINKKVEFPEAVQGKVSGKLERILEMLHET